MTAGRAPATAVLGALAAAAAVAVIARTQPLLATTLHQTKEADDVYVLPPTPQLRAMTLGYTAAATDLLWAKILVDYGIHHAEKREFPSLDNYVEALLALEPDYKNVFRYADTLLVYRPVRGYEKDARTARSVFERGIKARPDDADVWLAYGDFLAFISRTFLENEEEAAQWRKEGAEALLRAAELGATTDRTASAMSLLGRAGERDALLRNLKKTYAMTDDPDARASLAARIEALEGSQVRERVEARTRAFQSRWSNEASFLSRPTFLLVGPITDAFACAGFMTRSEARCATSWEEVLAEYR